MYFSGPTLDDLLGAIIPKLLRSRTRISPSRGPARELTGVLLNLRNPRARLSRTETRGRIFSCLGELLWYLSGTNALDFITYYIGRYRDESDDGETVYGGYGPRLFNMNGRIDQVENVRQLLCRNPDTRRAVIQLFDARDLAAQHQEVPCTCTLQFLHRGGALHMFTHMRSNDAFVGLAHDVFAFTMLQEIMARSLGVQLGQYKHAVGSLHLYESDVVAAGQFLDEGFQESIAMPEMPAGNPWPSIRSVLAVEEKLRAGSSIQFDSLKFGDYWDDLVRLLRVYALFKRGERDGMRTLMRQMSVDVYDTYIRQKHRAVRGRSGTAHGGTPDLFRMER